MNTRRFGELACVLVLGCSTLYGVSPSPAAGDRKPVAGHDILRVYDERSSGVVLSSPSVIFEDHGGLIWVSNIFGVNVYDKEMDAWRSFGKHAEHVVGRPVTMIGQSLDKKVWFASGLTTIRPGANLSCFDGVHWQKVDASSEDLGPSTAVTAMFPGLDGRLWLAVKNELRVYDGRRWTLRIKLSEATGDDVPVTVRAGLQSRDGCIWLATSNGIVRFDQSKEQWMKMYPIQRPGRADDDPALSIYARMAISDGVYRIYEDRNRRIWFGSAGSSGYQLVYDSRRDSWSHYELMNYFPDGLGSGADMGLMVMYQDRTGRMMFGTKLGLLTLAENENKWELFTPGNSGLTDPRITSVLEDSGGRIWLGTGKGIVVLDP
jgi:ligand-binding sensor domain-containing protein